MRRLKSPKLLIYLSFGFVAILFIAHNFTLAGKGEESLMNEDITFENTVLDFEKRYDQADYLFNVAEWNSNLHSDDKGMSEILNEYEEKLQAVINDEENFKRIAALREKYRSKGKKGIERDITEKWHRYLDRIIVLDGKAKELQKEEMKSKNRLSAIWNVYRPKMKDSRGGYVKDKETGKDRLYNTSEINRILSKSKDRKERQGAFEAQSAVGFELLNNGFRDLVKLRNDFARARGHENYYTMKYSFGGFEEKHVFEMFDRIVRETDDVTRRSVDNFLKRERLAKFEPWDADYASTGFSYLIDDYLTKEGLIGALKESYKRLGIDLDRHGIKMDIDPRPGKYPHAACWWIKFADWAGGKFEDPDIRFMANVDKGGIDQYSTVFHENGHAVHGANIRQKHTIDKNVNLTYLYDMGGFVESIAMTFDKIPYEEEWFLKYSEFEKSKKEKTKKGVLKEAHKKFDSESKPWEAFHLRNLLVKVYFEREIYSNPDADYNAVWWDNMARLLFVEKHADLPHWAHKIHFITHPAYYQFYVLADLMSAQNVHYFKAKYGTIVDNENVGKKMIKFYFEPGNSVNWEDMLKNLTGEKLNPKHKIDAVTKI